MHVERAAQHTLQRQLGREVLRTKSLLSFHNTTAEKSSALKPVRRPTTRRAFPSVAPMRCALVCAPTRRRHKDLERTNILSAVVGPRHQSQRTTHTRLQILLQQAVASNSIHAYAAWQGLRAGHTVYGALLFARVHIEFVNRCNAEIRRWIAGLCRVCR